MADGQFIKVSREFLYNEIWKISVAGTARKYNIPYAELLRLCKEVEIPIPPSGYWTKLSFGKPVEKIQLPGYPESEVILPINDILKCSDGLAKSEYIASSNEKHNKTDIKDKKAGNIIQSDSNEEKSASEFSDENENTPLTYRTLSDKSNVYNREKLYEEVWAKPVIQVAVKYGVSDVMIHKICKSLDIPVPPRGYWTRLRAGEKIEKPLLPIREGVNEIIGYKTIEEVSEVSQQTLAFLSEYERQEVLLASKQIRLSGEKEKLHKKIRKYHPIVREWNKNDRKDKGAQRSFRNYTNVPPFLAGVISNEALPRVYRILDALYRQIEMLGGSVNDDLSLIIRNERVTLKIFEVQDEVKHELTRQEAQELVVYEDALRHSEWASKPNIRKHDYIFNGKLRISILKNKYFRDSEKAKVESRLGDMLIELYEESEVVRKKREADEETQRKRDEEKRLREEREMRYSEEVDKTIALTNIAQDYDMACKIRNYIDALELKTDLSDEKTAEWIDWAKRKADWFDPIIGREDELFGRREHEKSEDEKALRKSRNYWW
ncbi:hypothetical protein [Sporanaerobacter sp. PP17-6a]|uniref:hypothetical protein n=1 Tax=Sporanaerobacter sp. PP17-6a TaxID=1891289 RepID=UPI0008A07988|nr:hypothetical protein [Sporanaerobacter sp. PP17-6a]SCL85454.1 hypothetical protein PP176A_0868 [Sporanaerobacter sp. PP17-6a]